MADIETTTAPWPSPVELPLALQAVEYSPAALKARAKVVNVLLDKLAQRSGTPVAVSTKTSGAANPVVELLLDAGIAMDLSGALIVLLECTGEDAQVRQP